jgi:hypothetical protein
MKTIIIAIMTTQLFITVYCLVSNYTLRLDMESNFKYVEKIIVLQQDMIKNLYANMADMSAATQDKIDAIKHRRK